MSAIVCQCMGVDSLSHKIYNLATMCIKHITLYGANPFSMRLEIKINLLSIICVVSYTHIGDEARRVKSQLFKFLSANGFLLVISTASVNGDWSLSLKAFQLTPFLQPGCFIQWGIFLRPLPACKVQVNFLPLVCNPLHGLGNFKVIVSNG